MGTELQMARKEKYRWPLLLDRAGAGTSGHSEVRREERTEATSSLPRGKKGSTTATPAQSKSHAATKIGGREGSRSQGYREDNHTGRPVDGLADRDTAYRGSAKVVDVKWVDSKCTESTAPTGVHHWTEAFKVADGGMFLCRYCRHAKWLPNSLHVAMQFTALAKKLGVEAAYEQILSEHPTARRALLELQDCHLLGAVQFAVVLGRVMATRAEPQLDRTVWWESPPDWWLKITEQAAEAWANR